MMGVDVYFWEDRPQPFVDCVGLGEKAVPLFSRSGGFDGVQDPRFGWVACHASGPRIKGIGGSRDIVHLREQRKVRGIVVAKKELEVVI